MKLLEMQKSINIYSRQKWRLNIILNCRHIEQEMPKLMLQLNILNVITFTGFDS